ncbi:MAG: MFS transporter, partial [Nitrospirae bacterium]
MYDFANSSYSAVIAAVVFPVFFVKHIAPTHEVGDIWWGRAVALSMLLVASTSPFAGGIADLSGYRKRFFIFYTLMSVLAITGLSFSEGLGFFWVVCLFIIANFFFEGGVVFYNAFLPEVAPKEKIGRVSGWGFGLGYLGSALSLLISIYLVKIGYYTLAFLSVGIFFFVFSLPCFFFLKETQGGFTLKEAALKGWTKIIHGLASAFRKRDFRLFLISYFFFRDGVNTIIAFSSIFAANTLGFSYEKLLYLYLLIQLTAMAGAFLFSWPTDQWGPKRVLVLCLLVWS